MVMAAWTSWEQVFSEGLSYRIWFVDMFVDISHHLEVKYPLFSIIHRNVFLLMRLARMSLRKCSKNRCIHQRFSDILVILCIME